MILNGLSDMPSRWHVKTAHIGVDILIDPGVEIGTPEQPLDYLYIGDHVSLHGPSRFMPRNLVIGDYTKIYDGFWCGGDSARAGGPVGGDAYFGHNVWLAPRCIADPTGGIYIGNNFGAGHETHMWSHIRHGDTLAGCRYLSYSRFVAEDDVWLVGRCTANPVYCESMSVAMTSAQVVRDMKQNRVYAGNPAIDITDKVGAPWVPRPHEDRWAMFWVRLEQFRRKHGYDKSDLYHVTDTFDVMTRTYLKTNNPIEVALMRYLLPEAKFLPSGQEGKRIESNIVWPERPAS